MASSAKCLAAILLKERLDAQQGTGWSGLSDVISPAPMIRVWGYRFVWAFILAREKRPAWREIRSAQNCRLGGRFSRESRREQVSFFALTALARTAWRGTAFPFAQTLRVKVTAWSSRSEEHTSELQ